MRTEHSGAFLGISIKSTIASSPPLAGPKGTVSTYRKTTEALAQTGRQFATPISQSDLGRAFLVAGDATLRPKPTPLKSRLPKWKDKEYRHGYLAASIEQGVAWQIKVNRQVRGLSQQDLAAMLGTHQSAVSRLEDTEYGAHSMDSLIAVAHAFDCALSVRFVPYSDLARESEDLSPEKLLVEPFSVEVAALE